MNVTASGYTFTGSLTSANNLGGSGSLIINPGAGNLVEFSEFHVDTTTDRSRAVFSGGTTVESGTLRLRVNAPSQDPFAVSFGTGAITMNNGTTLWMNKSPNSSNATFLLQNDFFVNGNVTFDYGRQTANHSSRLAGTVHLNGQLTMTASTGGGGAISGGPHGISGDVEIDQSTSGSRGLIRGNGEGNQGFTITGNIVDGAGSAENQLILRTGTGTSDPRQTRILGENNTYSHGTIIQAPTTAATALNAADGFQRAIVVGANSSLGLGDVQINSGALLTLEGSENIHSDATLTISDLGFLHLVDGVDLVFNQTDSVFAWNAGANSLISLDPGFYTVAMLNNYFGNNSAGDSTFYGDGSITVIPEPSTYALIFGAFALAGIILKRRLRR